MPSSPEALMPSLARLAPEMSCSWVFIEMVYSTPIPTPAASMTKTKKKPSLFFKFHRTMYPP